MMDDLEQNLLFRYMGTHSPGGDCQLTATLCTLPPAKMPMSLR
jgi:hypothetical protein